MNRLLVIGAAALLASINVVAVAQVQRSGSDAGAARVLQQLQQVTADRDKALAEGEKLKKENDDLKVQLKTAAAERDALRKRSAAAAAADSAQKEAESTAAQEKLRGQLQEVVGRYRDIAQNLKDVETDRAAKTQLVARQEQELQTCVDHNARLYTLNGEVLNRLEGQGLWTTVGRNEPFTRLKRTQLENLADQYRDRARDDLLPAATTRP